jgi:plastocyanin
VKRGGGRGGRVAAAIGALVLALGIVLAVLDVFRTSHPATASAGGDVRLNHRYYNDTPQPLVVDGGRSVTFVLRDESVHAHTFTSPELGVDVALEPGQSRSVMVSVPRDGQFGFYCRFHQASNMRGYVQFRG